VFWQVGSSATLGSGSLFVGNILALTSITVESSVVVHGRALARNAAVTLDNNVFTQPSCTPTTDVVPTATAPSTTAAPATTPAPVVTPAPSGPASSVPGNTGVTPTTVASTGPFNATDITLPATGRSTATMSGIGLAALLMGLAAILITRRREPA
jgi:type VI secretion system secreted protein VgrG